jgi:hypothetical protein
MRQHPDWLPVLDPATAVAAREESVGGEFARASVVAELERRGIERRVPNLRLLAAYGPIAKSGPSTSGGDVPTTACLIVKGSKGRWRIGARP